MTVKETEWNEAKRKLIGDLVSELQRQVEQDSRVKARELAAGAAGIEEPMLLAAALMTAREWGIHAVPAEHLSRLVALGFVQVRIVMPAGDA